MLVLYITSNNTTDNHIVYTDARSNKTIYIYVSGMLLELLTDDYELVLSWS